MFSEDEESNTKVTSRLQSLFGSSENNSGDHSFDVSNTGKPSQISNVISPATSSNEASTAASATTTSSSVLHLITVKVVQTFVFRSNKYEPYGKLAAALLGNSSLKHYQIILYRNKNDHISKAFISSSFWFGVQGNNYASFYDHNSVVWTVLFEVFSDLVEFCTEVALAKWMCSVDQNKILIQDVVSLSSGKSVKLFDNIYISYIISPLDNQHRPLTDYAVEGNNTLNLSLKDEWEKSILNIFENSRRLLVIPQKLLGPWKKLIDRSCNFGVLLDLTVKRIDDQQEQDIALKTTNVDLVLPKLPSNDDELKTDNLIQAKSAVLSESSSENLLPKHSDLLSRMGRLGKPTLPVKVARVPTTACDSDDTEDDASSTHSGLSNLDKSNKSNPKKLKQNVVQSHPFPAVQLPVVSSFPQQQLFSNTVVGYPGLTAITPVALSPTVDPQLPMLFSEQRMNNSELRMNVCLVTDKVDKIIDKVQACPTDRILQKLESINKEIMCKFSSLNEQNNETLKLLLSEYREEVTNGNKVMKNELLAEKSNDMQNENKKLFDSLVETDNLIKEIQEKVNDCEAKKNEIEEQLSCEKKATEDLRKELINTALGFNIEPFFLSTKENVETTLHGLFGKMESLQKSLTELNLQEDTMSLGDEEETNSRIREQMNNLYKMLKLQFKPDSSYSSKDIYDILSNIMKPYC